MHSLFWKIFLAMWLSIVGFSAAIGWLNDTLARKQWAKRARALGLEVDASGQTPVAQRSEMPTIRPTDDD